MDLWEELAPRPDLSKNKIMARTCWITFNIQTMRHICIVVTLEPCLENGAGFKWRSVQGHQAEPAVDGLMIRGDFNQRRCWPTRTGFSSRSMWLMRKCALGKEGNYDDRSINTMIFHYPWDVNSQGYREQSCIFLWPVLAWSNTRLGNQWSVTVMWGLRAGVPSLYTWGAYNFG